MLAPIVTLALAGVVHGHTAAWANGMFCKGGPNPNVDDSNTNTAVNPLYQLTKSSWWFQHDRGCDLVPPPSGEFLQLPAGQSFTVELAHNRGQTTLSFGGSQTSDWPDGLNHPDNYGPVNGAECVSDGALHTVNEQTAGGTAFAISYVSSISAVTMENLVVFTTLEHTPWKRLATYQVPAALPACPDGGCICAWLWVPNGCGTPNMYMQGFKCKVTGATSTVPVAKAQVPTYCADDSSKCVKGAKQMIAWNQLDGNNIVIPSGTPNYNQKNGWASGAQNDIFVTSTPPTSSWNAIGCYIDTNTRILPNRVNVPGGLTNNACKTACQAAGYNYAGTEIESECWCGNSLSSGATQVDISQCNLACSSNTGEQCGGVWRLRAFAFN